ncbi:hypothetical protein [Desulfoferrobacter suflitae]|uniref:hypothetical protein n=1 Tax=Desulfoferrobacter suflitae TaxID=2865782 RepID=UPI002164279A|nr:hypothetical protein [Desulfoferrobacter suflitae]MCK8602876.1 hypothetical protein [Desulfoferrobacter suflitae]
MKEPEEMVDAAIGLVGHIVFGGFSLLNRFVEVYPLRKETCISMSAVTDGFRHAWA